MFAKIYTGCKCEETWRVSIHEDIDTERDEIYEIPYCEVCGGNNLREKKDENGVPCMHALTADEIHYEMDNYSEEDEGFDYNDY